MTKSNHSIEVLQRENNALLARITALEEAQTRHEQLVDKILHHVNSFAFLYDYVAKKAITVHAEEFLGYGWDELFSSVTAGLSFVHDDDRSAVHEQWNTLANSALNETLTYDFRFISKAGTLEWVQGTVIVTAVDAQGTPTQALITFKIITEHKQSEDTIHALINAVEETLFLMEVDGTIIVGNEEVARRYGTTVSQLPGTNTYGYAPDALSASRKTYAEQVIATGQPVTFEDQRGPWLFENRLFPVKDGTDVVTRIAVFGRDITHLKQTEEALRSSQRLLSKAENAARIGIYSWDIINNTLQWSDTMKQLLDSVEETPSFELLVNKIHPDDREFVFTVFQESFVSHAPYTVEYRVQWNDGTIHYLRDTAETFYDEHGNAVRVLGANQDITDLKLAEQEVGQLEERFAKIFHSSPALIILSDQQTGRMIEANDSFYKVTGYTPEETIGKTSSEVGIWVDDVQRKTIHDTLRTSSSIKNIEVPCYNKQGDLLMFLGSYEIIILDGSPCVLTAFIDITDRTKARTALQESEERYRALVESSPTGISVLRENKVLYINSASAEILGLTSTDLIDDIAILDLISPEYLDTVKSRAEQVESGTPTQPAEIRMFQVDGTPIWIQSSSVPIMYEGEPATLLLTQDITHRIRTENELARERDLITRLMQITPIAITITDSDGAITFANKRAEEVLGINIQEITARDFNTPDWQITDYDGNPLPDGTLPFMQVKRTLKPVEDFRHAITWPNGDMVFLSINASPIFDADGDFEGMIAAVQDNTTQHIAEAALRESRERYYRLFNSMLDGYALHELIVDDHGKPIDYRFLDINPAFSRMTGLNPSVIGKTVLEVLPNTEQHWIDTYGNVVLSGEPIRFQNYAGGLDRRWFEVVAYKTQDMRFTVIFQDITESKRAEEAEREQRTLATALVESTEAINSTINFEEVLERILEVLVKVVPHEGANVMLLDDGRQNIRIAKHCNCYYKNNLPAPITDVWMPLERFPNLLQMSKNDEVYSIHDTSTYPGWDTSIAGYLACYMGAPILIDGQVIGFLNVDSTTPHYFTEQHAERLRVFADHAAIAIRNARMYRQLETSNEHLEQAVEARTAELSKAYTDLLALSKIKDEFVSNVSHELRTPIANLVLHQHLVRIKPDSATHHLDVIKHETDRLKRTIEDLLRLSRLDQDRTQVELKPADLVELVRLIVEDRVLLAVEREIALRFKNPLSSSLNVMVDSGLLEQTVSIMLTNAINYTPRGGDVVVTMHSEETDGTSWAGFSVADNGLGISQEEQEQLFNRFFRGEAGTVSQTAGTGLGLAIAKEIIDRHDGRIEVSSKGIQGEGTTFTVWLPIDNKGG